MHHERQTHVPVLAACKSHNLCTRNQDFRNPWQVKKKNIEDAESSILQPGCTYRKEKRKCILNTSVGSGCDATLPTHRFVKNSSSGVDYQPRPQRLRCMDAQALLKNDWLWFNIRKTKRP
jgi:hypothetical protein